MEEGLKSGVRLVQTPVQRTAEKNVRGKMRRRGDATNNPAMVRLLLCNQPYSKVVREIGSSKLDAHTNHQNFRINIKLINQVE